MTCDFKIRALEKNDFANLFNEDDAELKKIGALRMTVDANPGFPCRVSLQDAEIGEEVILLPYQHHKTASPYQSSGPIFIRKVAETATLQINEIPKMLNHRLLSLRCYNKDGIMIDATVIEGKVLKEKLTALFENGDIKYIHIHNAKPGCYNCVAERV